MPVPVLLTQSLQVDFVGPVPPHGPLPNRLHVGHQEARRLLGADPAHGPVAQLMAWARSQPDLVVGHIRDWHDPTDPRQVEHLQHFGHHCIAGSEGARLVLGLDDDMGGAERHVDSGFLNDFEDTDLGGWLDGLRQAAPDGALRVGVVGVWTEAKVTFLLYDLKTRLGVGELATCSALTASASRAQHFNALGQLQKILGVRVFDSVGEFSGWLSPGAGAEPALVPLTGPGPEVQGAALDGEDADVVARLFRESVQVELRALSGGYSGARVFAAKSRDALGHGQAPCVLKLGPRARIAQERQAFERVEEILGNDAPSVLGAVEAGARGGLRYAYAAMGQGGVRSLQSLYQEGADDGLVGAVLDEVLSEVLGRFYRAAGYERLPLVEHYGFAPHLADAVASKVRALTGDSMYAPEVVLPDGRSLPNVALWYRDALHGSLVERSPFHYVSYVHGDLNGANVLVDGRRNVWVIDFFHTARSHVLKDLAKLESDLLYIWTPLADDSALRDALRVTHAQRAVVDLRAPLPEDIGLQRPELRRAWRFVRQLRGHVARLCREDRDPWQMSVALLRYAASTLFFDEPDERQRRWALYAACDFATDVVRLMRPDRRLRVDWLPPEVLPGGALGLTICPGRRDQERVLSDDLDALQAAGVDRLVTLLTPADLVWAGVGDLPEAVVARGIAHERLSIPDQQVPSPAEARDLVDRIRVALACGERVVVHCMGGIGRSGLIAACVMVAEGADPDDAIRLLRTVRDPRAVETVAQEDFVRSQAARS